MPDRGPPMRITLVLPQAGMSGGVRVLAIYAEALQRRGHRVSVVSWPAETKPLARRLRNLVSGKGWSKPAARRSHFDGCPVEHRVLEKRRAVTDADVPDADVVVATWWETAPAVAALSPSKGAKCYFIQHDERHISRDQHDAVADTYRLPMPKIVVAQWLADMLEREFGDRGVTVVPNSVDLERFHAPERGKQDRPTVGFMYSRAKFKGTPLALEAIELARRSLPQLHVKSFGLVPPQESSPLPSGSDYTINPGDEVIARVYGGCDVWLFPSRIEGFGLPLLEAMACRTPVVGTPTGAAPQLVEPGGGVLVPHDDPEAMAEAILRLIRLDDAQWRQRSAQARALAEQYTWDRAIDLFEEALRRATHQSPERLAVAAAAVAG